MSVVKVGECLQPCIACGRCCCITDRRVYFGVVGPFCAVACREQWLAAERRGPRSAH